MSSELKMSGELKLDHPSGSSGGIDLSMLEHPSGSSGGIDPSMTERKDDNSSGIEVLHPECRKTLGDSDNVVIVTLLNCDEINLTSVVHFVPIIKLWGQCGPISISTASKISFPYYGIPNAIISIRYKDESRGVRANTKYMKGVVSIDLQTCGKNIHINLSGRKMHITGAKTREMGIFAFNVLCAHLNMARDNLSYFNSLQPAIIEATKKYTLDVVKKNLISRIQIIEATQKSTGRTIILDQPSYDLNIINRQAPSNVDAKLTSFLLTHATEFVDYQLFERRVNNILAVKTICNTPISVASVSICNDVFNYPSSKFHPDFQSSNVSFIKLSEFFLKNKFSVQYHNWKSTGLKVSIPLKTVSEASSIKKKAKAHRFEFTKKNSVRQNSPTDYYEANIAFNTICDYIELFLKTESQLNIFGSSPKVTLDTADRAFV